MIKDTQIHYTFDNKAINDLLEAKGYYLCNGYTYKRLINTVVEIFLNEYTFIDCVFHVLNSDENEDIDNTEIENTIFNIIAFYTETHLHSLQRNEIVSDVIKLNDDIIYVYIHDVEKDTKKKYYLKLDKQARYKHWILGGDINV